MVRRGLLESFLLSNLGGKMEGIPPPSPQKKKAYESYLKSFSNKVVHNEMTERSDYPISCSLCRLAIDPMLMFPVTTLFGLVQNNDDTNLGLTFLFGYRLKLYNTSKPDKFKLVSRTSFFFFLD